MKNCTVSFMQTRTGFQGLPINRPSLWDQMSDDEKKLFEALGQKKLAERIYDRAFHSFMVSVAIDLFLNNTHPFKSPEVQAFRRGFKILENVQGYRTDKVYKEAIKF